MTGTGFRSGVRGWGYWSGYLHVDTEEAEWIAVISQINVTEVLLYPSQIDLHDPVKYLMGAYLNM